MMQKVRGRTVRRHSASTACRYTVSGSISLSSSEFFSPFPHGTSSLSVTGEYLALEGGPPGFPQNYTCSVVLRNVLEPLSVSLTGLSPSLAELSNSVQLPTPVPYRTPYNHRRAFMSEGPECEEVFHEAPYEAPALRGAVGAK